MAHVEVNAFATAIKERLKKTNELPAMPELAHELLQLRNNTHANVDDLVALVSRDPGLAAQIMRYAHSAMFGLGRKITSLQQAITVVMGFDTALHLTLGFAAGKFLQTPAEGPLGRCKVWQHSLGTAALAQELAARMPNDIRPEKGLCYLAGLLHDFGLLLFGHWYPKQYNQLNRLVENNPGINVREMELIAFGISHDAVGREMMKAWNLPEEIVISAGEHHFPDYDGKCAVYVKLIALANHLIERPGLSDTISGQDNAALLEYLHLTEQQTKDALAKVKENQAEFQEIAKQLVV